MASTKNEPARMGRPSGLSGALGELAEAMGGVEHLARDIGVTARTIQRWDKGEISPSEPARRVLGLLAKQHRITTPFETHRAPDIQLRAGERELLLLVAGAPRGKISRAELLKKLTKAMGTLEEKTTFVSYVNAMARAELIDRESVDEDIEIVSITKAGRATVRQLKKDA